MANKTYRYKGWLNSDSFMKRALAIMGYSTIGELILLLIFGVLWGILTLFTAI